METIKVSKKHEATQINIKTSHRKEKNFSKGLSTCVVNLKGGISEVITTRLYWTKGGTCTACVWLHCGTYDGASGRATGYGYCKESAAAAEALANVGFTFNEWIGGGIGMQTIQEALKAAAENITGKPCQILTAHA